MELKQGTAHSVPIEIKLFPVEVIREERRPTSNEGRGYPLLGRVDRRRVLSDEFVEICSRLLAEPVPGLDVRVFSSRLISLFNSSSQGRRDFK